MKILRILITAALLVASISGPVLASGELSRTGLASTGYSATLFDGYMPLAPAGTATQAHSSLSGVLVIDKRPRTYTVTDREECLHDLRWSSAGWASLGGAVMGAFTGIIIFMTTPAAKSSQPWGLMLGGGSGGAAIGALVGYYVIDERKCAVTNPTTENK